MKITIALYLLVMVSGTAMTQNSITLDSTVRFDYINGDSVPGIKNIFFYIVAGQLIEEIEQNWSLINIRWENNSSHMNHYSNGKQDTVTNWVYQAEDWIPTSRIITEFDGDKLLETKTQNWNDSLALWQNNSLTLHGMASEKYSFIIRRQWDSTNMLWYPVDSVLTVLDSTGLAQSDTTYSWLDLANTYLYTSLTKFQYDSIGHLIVRARYNYDFDSLEFRPRSRDTFAYDENGFQNLSQFDAWLQPLQIWEPSFRIERMANEYGYIVQSNLFFYDFIAGQLKPSSLLEYNYITPEEDGLIHSVINYVYQGPFEIPDYKRLYYYSADSTTATKLNVLASIQIYPNPASDYVYLAGDLKSINHYRWYSLDGKILSSGHISENKLSIPFWQNGPLLLMLLSEGGDPIQVSQILHE